MINRKRLSRKASLLLLWVLLPVIQACLNDNNSGNDPLNSDAGQSSLVIGTINRLDEEDNKGFYLTMDNGKTLFPSNAQEWAGNDYADGQRAFVQFSFLNQPASGYDYNIWITEINEVLTKNIVTIDGMENTEENIGNDKINLTYMWVSNDRKYLTIEFQYYGTGQSNKKHFLNLVADETDDGNADSAYFPLEFRHNSEGDAPQQLGEGYVSFKLEQIADRLEGKKGLSIRVNTLYDGVKDYSVDFATAPEE